MESVNDMRTFFEDPHTCEDEDQKHGPRMIHHEASYCLRAVSMPTTCNPEFMCIPPRPRRIAASTLKATFHDRA